MFIVWSNLSQAGIPLDFRESNLKFDDHFGLLRKAVSLEAIHSGQSLRREIRICTGILCRGQSLCIVQMHFAELGLSRFILVSVYSRP